MSEASFQFLQLIRKNIDIDRKKINGKKFMGGNENEASIPENVFRLIESKNSKSNWRLLDILNKLRRRPMKTALNNVNGWLGGIVGLLKTVIVFFVFAGILWPTGLPNAIGGVMNLIGTFIGGGLAGLLALVVFVSFMD